jgi:hypothetical protein
MSEMMPNREPQAPEELIRLHEGYNPVTDEYNMRIERPGKKPDHFDVHRDDNLRIWFDHDNPGDLVAVSTEGAATTWPQTRHEQVFTFLGESLANAHKELAENLLSERHSDLTIDPETRARHLEFHIKYRELAGDPISEDQIEDVRREIVESMES